MIPTNKEFIVKPFNKKEMCWVEIECMDEKAYNRIHQQINGNDVEHICNKSEHKVYVNAAEFIQLWTLNLLTN